MLPWLEDSCDAPQPPNIEGLESELVLLDEDDDDEDEDEDDAKLPILASLTLLLPLALSGAIVHVAGELELFSYTGFS